ncbi:PREDICTED: uncharacterized protein LOC108363240 [Rhagoletis zephyria]|uniref:uncharacterized protein LOC108363240 n=1 Tax=Rhagoletis zephyria TaxID=28612 RepID=UPI00081145D6|nr:PREDICTED: uncharacterized protein LOC108363240 [Rhagoletis zephyria]XP_036340504.1 uncharacterized protein CG45078 [Rhagoletis pomonella]
MVYESGFTTRRTYTSRPIVTSYAVSRKTPIDWEKCPYVPRASLVADPITAFGSHRPDSERRKCSILDPINREAIKPNYRILHEPIKPYVSARDRNRERILNLARQHFDAVEAGGTTTARISRDSIDAILPRIHRAASENLKPVRRESYRNERSGATVTKYYY